MIWSHGEVDVLARAVSRAPSVHNTQPWVLQAERDAADLYERFESWLPKHDPAGRDRVISCGAALANLDLAVRTLGWDAQTTLLPDPDRPDLVARVLADGRRRATAADVDLYSAIFRRRSYRAPFSLHRIGEHNLAMLAASAAADGAEVRVVHGAAQATALAELLGYAARVLRADHAYQRELQAWSAQFREPLPAVTTLPWSGLVRADSHLPDTVTLTERLLAEGLLVVFTPDDTRRDQLRAGTALQQVWLNAVNHGLAGSVLTQPLHLNEVRAGLIEHLDLPGHPQAILRLGYPVTATPPVPTVAGLSEKDGWWGATVNVGGAHDKR
ncbi:Acg family FMN-binding oxidoreductase [Amycolatopsis pithecellobii]|uniref:Nitroreductase domain-containing protein n=1 Tax=Amycolatopsis pithecellobii TaxID=664692 RepID=A0A6N7YNN6_9PSEU|nr:nitroreductase family protein [Amycolatopsis pithecellobii]MTD54617.1 hypothetical protein [Amycolatopsis pithecellobii]